MWKVVVIAVLSALCCTYALDYSLCQQTPKEKYCLIANSMRDKVPHQVRYVYNRDTKTCSKIRWSGNCPAVPSPPTTNNFVSEGECYKECGRSPYLRTM